MNSNLRDEISGFKGVWRKLFWIVVATLACKYTNGYSVAVIALVALTAIAKNQPGTTFLCYIMFPMLIQINPTLRGESAMFGILCRICPVVLTILIMIQSSQRKGRNVLPLGGLYIYLVFALISSINGWCPIISYLKIANFLVLLFAMHIGMRNFEEYPAQLTVLREGILAFSIFVIVGSVATIPFPEVGYSMLIRNYRYWGQYIGDASEFVRNLEGVKLFSGVLNHSQTLAPVVVACSAWTFLDMLFIERRITFLHCSLIGLSPILLFMTRSRIGLVGLIFVLVVIHFFTMPRLRMDMKIKMKIKQMFMVMSVLGLLCAVVAEARSQSMTRWFRKMEDVGEDKRELSEAMIESRMGKIEENLYDFHKNPILGMGFQTTEDHAIKYQQGAISIFSAPIEKGVLPYMILGETGVIGLIVFALFLIMFYHSCATKRYVCTSTLMSVFLVLNMAEASFFSPGGLGGALWVILIGGGFTIDMIYYSRTRIFHYLEM